MSIYFQDPYYFSKFITTVVLVTQIVAVITLLLMLVSNPKKNKWLRFLANNSTLLAFIVALTAMCSAFFYSDVLDMAPCKLCWYQRIFIFPQVVLLAVALWKKQHKEVVAYSLAFVCIALPISIFHYILQRTDAPAVHAFAPCDVTGQAPSCSSYYVIMYDYITIPMMALTTSVLIGMLMLLRLRK